MKQITQPGPNQIEVRRRLNSGSLLWLRLAGIFVSGIALGWESRGVSHMANNGADIVLMLVTAIVAIASQVVFVIYLPMSVIRRTQR